MPESQTRTPAEQPDALFDRYTLPKVALAVILAGSLVGTWVSVTLSGSASATFAVIKWAYFVSMGVLVGGLVWKHLFVRPADLGNGAADYCTEMYGRFDDIAAGAIVVLGISGTTVFLDYLSVFGLAPTILGYGTLIGTWLALAAATTYRSDSVQQQFRSPVGLAALTLALAVVIATAVAEVAMRGLNPVAAGIRVLHLLAFAMWIGGAVWNIFVAVPTGQKRPTTGVVRVAGEQLERFRWAVRFIIPILFLTGLYQAISSFGMNPEWYLGSAIGWAILAKVGFIGLLVVIFKLCPMWRACSPIEGVCELEDLKKSSVKESKSSNSGRTDNTSEVIGHD